MIEYIIKEMNMEKKDVGIVPDMSTDITVLAVYVPEAECKPSAVTDRIRLAKQHGISGFAVVYDPSDGLQSERFMDVLAAQEEIPFSFTAICVYDGIKAPEQFITGLAGYMKSDSYLRIDGKPVICLDNPEDTVKYTEIGSVFDAWRKTAVDLGAGEILIWACDSHAGAVPQNNTIKDIWNTVKPDAFYEFPPRGKDYAASCAAPDGGTAHDYGSLIEGARWFCADNTGIPVYRGSMLDWDDSDVNEQSYDCWIGFSPERFYLWNRINIRFLREHYRQEDRILFVNAWNDREHGTVLEPDSTYGTTYLKALSKAVNDLPYEDEPDENSLYYLGAGSDRMQRDLEWHGELDAEPLIAVHAHVFYPELLEEVLDYVSRIPFRFDLYISTDAEEKRDVILRYTEHSEHVYVKVHPNRGRDVAPFLSDMRERINGYRYFCHIHTKKSQQNAYGNAWRRYLFRNLLGSETLVREILYMFESEPDLGIVMPQSLDLIRGAVRWRGNRENAEVLMSRMGFPGILPDNKREENIMFPAGNMFWARTDAVRQMFDVSLGPAYEDFPEEQGQLDGTVMHAIERVWCYLARANGYRCRITRYLGDNRPLDLLKI